VKISTVILAITLRLDLKAPDPKFRPTLTIQAEPGHYTGVEARYNIQGFLDNCHIFWVHVSMGRWKRHGVIVVLFSTDHDPKHVHDV
jgi:hypothetical protein